MSLIRCAVALCLFVFLSLPQTGSATNWNPENRFTALSWGFLLDPDDPTPRGGAMYYYTATMFSTPDAWCRSMPRGWVPPGGLVYKGVEQGKDIYNYKCVFDRYYFGSVDRFEVRFALRCFAYNAFYSGYYGRRIFTGNVGECPAASAPPPMCAAGDGNGSAGGAVGGSSYGFSGVSSIPGSGQQTQQSLGAGVPTSVSTGFTYRSETDWKSSVDPRFAFTRHYRSDLDDRHFRGRYSHGGNWSTIYDEVIDDRSVFRARYSGADWLHFSADGSRELYRPASNNVDGINRRAASDIRVGLDVGRRTIKDGTGHVRSYTPFNPGVGSGSTAFLSNMVWPDGYRITVERTPAGNELRTTAINDNRGQRAQFTWEAAGGVARAVVTRIDVDTSYDGETFAPDVAINYNYAVATPGALAHDNYRRVTLTASEVIDLNSAETLSRKEYVYQRSQAANIPLLTEVTEHGPNIPNGSRVIALTNYSGALGQPLNLATGPDSDQTALNFGDAEFDVRLTNALGKQSGMNFTTIQGVQKLTDVEGVATPSCLPTIKTIGYAPNPGAPAGYVYQTTERNGALTEYERDSRGRVVRKVENASSADERVTTYSWDSVKRLMLSRTTSQSSESYSYDADGLLTNYSLTDVLIGSPSQGQSRDWVFTYTTLDSGLKVLTSVDGPGDPAQGINDVTSMTYLANGQLATVTDANGLVTQTLGYDVFGNPNSILLPNGVRVDATYDGKGNVLQITEFADTAASNTTTFTYDESDLLLSATDALMRVWTFSYDDNHRLTAVTGPDGSVTNYSYDALGNVLEQQFSDSSGIVRFLQSSSFDELGRLNSLTGAVGQLTSFGYDEEDNLVSIVDALGNSDQIAYDALNRAVDFADRDSYSSFSSYNDSDLQVSFIDPRNVETVFAYNGFGEVVTETSQDRGVINYTYDSRGLVSSMTDGRGVVSTYEYDNGGRILARRFPSDPARDQIFAYDETIAGAGQLTSVTDHVGTVTYAHDPNTGRVLSEARMIGEIEFLFDYGWDSLGNLETLLYPSGLEVTYTRDSFDRITQIDVDAPALGRGRYGRIPIMDTLVSGAEYAPFGPLTSLTYGDGGTQLRTYDQSYRMLSIQDTREGMPLRDIAYGWTARDNLQSVTDNLLPQMSENYGYSVREKLESATGDYGTLDFDYDGTGNRTLRSNAVGSDIYSYPTTSNRLESISFPNGSIGTFGYDSAGNVTSDDRTGNVFGYVYDAANRLSEFTIDGVVQASYEYNAFGQQVLRNLPQRRGSTIISMHGPDGNRIAEYELFLNGPGYSLSLLREYVWMDGTPVGVIENGQVFYVRTDHIGRPAFATDSTGEKVWEASYLPFGGVHVSTGSPIDLRFPGQWFQSETGLHQNWMRDYDPTTGRYIQPDPLGLVDGASVYGYALQNPGRYVDPDGREVRVYSSDAWGIAGLNHSFVWGTECECGAGRNGSSGFNGDGVGETNGPYNVVDLPPNMSEQEFIDKLNEPRSGIASGIYFPWLEDCHTGLERAFNRLGVQYPGAPGGRIDYDDRFFKRMQNLENSSSSFSDDVSSSWYSYFGRYSTLR